MSGEDLPGAVLLDGAGDADALARPFAALPVDGVAVSTLGSPFGDETVSASDPTAVRFDEIQFDLGEGPIWQTVRDRLPVLEPDLARAEVVRWPAASAALLEAGAGAVFAFPMRVAALDVGSVALYAARPTDLSARDVERAAALAGVTAAAVLGRALHRAGTERPGEWTDGGYARREIHQAVGMIAAQTGTTTEHALLLLRAAAWSAGRSARAVAADVLSRVIVFSGPDGTTPQRGTSHDGRP